MATADPTAVQPPDDTLDPSLAKKTPATPAAPGAALTGLNPTSPNPMATSDPMAFAPAGGSGGAPVGAGDGSANVGPMQYANVGPMRSNTPAAPSFDPAAYAAANPQTLQQYNDPTEVINRPAGYVAPTGPQTNPNPTIGSADWFKANASTLQGNAQNNYDNAQGLYNRILQNAGTPAESQITGNASGNGTTWTTDGKLDMADPYTTGAFNSFLNGGAGSVGGSINQNGWAGLTNPTQSIDPTGGGTGIKAPASAATIAQLASGSSAPDPSNYLGLTLGGTKTDPTYTPAGGQAASAGGGASLSPVSSGSPSAGQATTMAGNGAGNNGGVGLSAIDPSNSLINQTISPNTSVDRVATNNAALQSTIDNVLHPALDAASRSVAANSFGAGRGVSGMNRTAQGNLASDYGNQIANLANQSNANAVTGSIQDMYNNLGIAQQQQGFQAGQQQNAFQQAMQQQQLQDQLTNSQFSRGLQSEQAGYANDPAQTQLILSQLFGGQANQAGAAGSNLFNQMGQKAGQQQGAQQAGGGNETATNPSSYVDLIQQLFSQNPSSILPGVQQTPQQQIPSGLAGMTGPTYP